MSSGFRKNNVTLITEKHTIITLDFKNEFGYLLVVRFGFSTVVRALRSVIVSRERMSRAAVVESQKEQNEND